MVSIIAIIDEDGNVKLTVQGVKGQSCIEITKSIESELGISQVRTMKPEYYEQEEKQDQIQKG